ncbi:hypothetical protein ACI797_16660 [Geodermatophilus sp. SYSU D00691]
MTGTVDGSPEPEKGSPDPFVTQVCWLVATAGGKDDLVQRCGGLVSVRTLDNWTAGNYPRAKVSGAVRDLDGWAREHVPGYPTAAGVPGLVESSGPYRGTTSPAPEPAAPEPAEEPPAPARRWVRWATLAAAMVLVSAVSVVATLLVVREGGTAALADETDAAEQTADATEMIDLPLPSTGDGTLYTELSGSIGANTFADPRTLAGGGPEIPPNTEIQVRCRYYAPSVPSVSPDGFWYLIESEQWNGLWTPANSFMNGDVPGGPYIHNTDFAVPVCR